jgi:glycosyltransferase involved in cell wall biosynthesis
VKLLLICTTCPVPPHSGAALRELGWLRTAARFAEVALVTLTRNEREYAALTELEDTCPIVRGVRAPRRAARKIIDLFLANLTGVPYLVRSGHERRLREVVRQVVERWEPDVVQAELLPAAPYLEPVGHRGVPTAYSAHNVESRILAGPENRGQTSARTRRMATFEARVATEAHAVVAVSRREVEWFRQYSKSVHHVPNAVDLQENPFMLPSARNGRTLLFVGHLGYGPNVDAATTLARQVFPAVRRATPDLRCAIAGAAPSRAVRSLAGDGVEVVADPIDLAPLWDRAGALVCPLRWGAGSRIKILEAAARGVPVVSSSFGTDGLELTPGVHCSVGSDTSGMVEATTSLLRSNRDADNMAREARQAVEGHHSWPRLRSAMMEMYEGLTDHHGQE